MNAWKTQYLEGWLGQEDPELKLPQQQNKTRTKKIYKTNKTPPQTMFQNWVEQNERKLTLDMS